MTPKSSLFYVQRTTSSEYRKFGLLFSLILVVLFGLLLPWLFSNSFHFWPWVVALAISTISMVKPDLIWFLYKPWILFGGIMGIVNTRVILSLAFIILIVPLALVLRIRKKDLLDRKWDSAATSYWKPVVKSDPSHMRNIY